MTTKERPRVLLQVTEEDLAVVWAEANCPACQEGDCELVGDEHDLSVYWDLPEFQRAELVLAAEHALDNGTAMEAIHDCMWSAMERYQEFGPRREAKTCQVCGHPSVFCQCQPVEDQGP